MKITEFELDIDRYMLDCSAKGLSAKTLKSYEQTLRLFARYLEEKFEITDSKKVGAEHLRAYIRDIEKRGKFEISVSDNPKNYPERRQDYGKQVSKTTIANYYVRNIKSYYNYLYQERHIHITRS